VRFLFDGEFGFKGLVLRFCGAIHSLDQTVCTYACEMIPRFLVEGLECFEGIGSRRVEDVQVSAK